MTKRTTPHFLSMTTAEQAAHLESIPKPDPARLQREYEAAMLAKAEAAARETDATDTTQTTPDENTPPNPEALGQLDDAVVSWAIRNNRPPRTA